MDPLDGVHARPETYDAIVSRLAQQDKVPWYKKPNLRVLYLVMLPTCFGVQIASGIIVSMMNGLQAVPSWLYFFHNPRSTLLGLVSCIGWLGSILVSPFVPSVVDKLGRRYSILFGNVLIIVGDLLQGCSQNLTMFIIARFILGMGNAFPVVAASSLVGELSHPKERAIMSSLFGAFWCVGYIAAAGVVLTTFDMPSNWGWRIPSFIQMIPTLVQIVFIGFLPESPRWLISKGRGDEAYATLVKYHAEGDENSPFVKAEYTQIKQTLEIELRNTKTSWMEVLSTSGMRRRAIIASFLGIFMEWSGNGLISYFLSPVLDSVGIHDNRTKNVVNLTLSCWSLMNAVFFSFTVTQFPRRKAFLGTSIYIFIVVAAWTMASARYSATHDKIAAQAVLALIFLYFPGYNIGYTVLPYTYLVELFPFRVRAKGLTIFQWWGGFSALLNQFVNPIGIDNLGWKYYISYCVWIAFEVAFVYLMFPETSQRTLEELTFLYEDDERREAIERIESEIGHERWESGEPHLSESVCVVGSEEQPLLKRV